MRLKWEEKWVEVEKTEKTLDGGVKEEIKVTKETVFKHTEKVDPAAKAEEIKLKQEQRLLEKQKRDEMKKLEKEV